MKIKLLLFFSLCLAINVNAQCGGTPPPPGYNPVYGLDTDNDGFALFDIQYYVDYIDRPEMESYFGVSSSGYDATFYADMADQPFLYTNTSQNQYCGLGYQYNGSGPEFSPQPPCYWPVEFYFGSRGLLLITVPFDGDFDNDGILNIDEDTNFNRNLMDDDDDHDGIINLKDAVNNLGLHDNLNLLLSVYPNPVTHGIVMFESNTTITAVSIYDLSGKQLSETKINTNSIDVDTLATGIYFLKFQSENGSVYKRIAIN
jgi:hypothetical protein